MVSPLSGSVKRIVFVLPRMGMGGTERALLRLLRHAPREGAEITLLLLERGGELLEEVPSFVQIRYAAAGSGVEALRRRTSAALKKLGAAHFFSAAKRLYHALGPRLAGGTEAGEYDIAVAFADGLATWYTARSLRAETKLAFIHTDYRMAGYNAEKDREIYRSFQSVWLVSEKARESFLSALPEYAGAARVLRNAVDTAELRELAAVPPEGMRPGGLRLVTVGRLNHEKGVNKIPLVLKALLDRGLEVTWYLVGDGPERGALTASAGQLGLGEHLVLLGAKRNPYPYMAACDVYVQPSDYEGYCIALAEARALCRPCVACGFSGAAEQLRDGITGFVVGFSPQALAEKLSQLLADEDLRKQMSEALEQEDHTGEEAALQAWWDGLVG